MDQVWIKATIEFEAQNKVADLRYGVAAMIIERACVSYVVVYGVWLISSIV